MRGSGSRGNRARGTQAGRADDWGAAGARWGTSPAATGPVAVNGDQVALAWDAGRVARVELTTDGCAQVEDDVYPDLEVVVASFVSTNTVVIGAVADGTASVSRFNRRRTDWTTPLPTGGIDALTRQQAAELGPLGIRVNALAPGSVPTPGANSVITADGWKSRAQKSVLRYLPSAEEIGDAAVFLASDEAASITGVTLKIDAGMTITGP